MLHFGDSTYEASHRMDEARRVLAARQAGAERRPTEARPLAWLRNAYRRLLATVGRRLCDLGTVLNSRGPADSRAPGL